MSFTAVKGTAGVYGEQQKCIQSSVFVCNNPESQFCLQKMEDATINKYSCNFPAAILSDSFFFLYWRSLSLYPHILQPLAASSRSICSLFLCLSIKVPWFPWDWILSQIMPEGGLSCMDPLGCTALCEGSEVWESVMYMALGVQKPRVFRWPYWCLWPCGLLQSHMCKYIHSNTR